MQLVGNTPLVRLTHLEPPGTELWAKLEMQNFSGSIKARPAWEMLEQARLPKGSRLLEATSGNTGIALAALARMRGLHFHAVMPETATQERKNLLRQLGAEITFVQGTSNDAIQVAEEMRATGDWEVLDQYSNPANPEAHYKTTGPEIVRDLPEVNVFVAGLGTGGTLMGTGAYLQEQNPATQIVAAEPLESDWGMRSLREGFVPPILDLQKLSRKILVDAEAALLGTQQLLHAGILSGISGGANLSVALRIAEPGMRIVFVVADGVERYTEALQRDPETWSTLW